MIDLSGLKSAETRLFCKNKLMFGNHGCVYRVFMKSAFTLKIITRSHRVQSFFFFLVIEKVLGQFYIDMLHLFILYTHTFSYILNLHEARRCAQAYACCVTAMHDKDDHASFRVNCVKRKYETRRNVVTDKNFLRKNLNEVSSSLVMHILQKFVVFVLFP